MSYADSCTIQNIEFIYLSLQLDYKSPWKQEPHFVRPNPAHIRASINIVLIWWLHGFYSSNLSFWLITRKS